MNIPVLSYHSISEEISYISLNTKIFEKQIIFLKKLGYESVNFNEIDPNKKNQIVITFDDGYKDILINALPILKRHNFKATCFFVTNQIGKNNQWDNKKEKFSSKNIMSNDDIKKWFDSVLKSYDGKQVKYLSGKKKSKEVKLVDLEYKTKKELETIGRKIGIELDRRLTKDKLINRIKYKVRNRNRK